MRRIQIGIGPTLVMVALWATAAFAQTITVTTLTDTADPPFNADGVCGTGTISNLPGADGLVSLREAIIAANNTAGAQTITFAPSLSGGTSNINGPLPFLCGGDTTINGDLNGDNAPDITLNGSALPAGANGIVIISSNNVVNGLKVQNFPGGGIGVFHVSSIPFTVSNNTISNNIVSGGTLPIFVQASFGGTTLVGTINNTTVTGNTVSGATLFDGILVLTGDAPGSSIDGTTITNNKAMNNARAGIGVFTNLSSTGSSTSITHTTIAGNKVFSNTSNGIFADSFAGQNNTITGLVINNNDVHDNGFTGISVASGICGGRQNTMEATISQNTLMRNGPADGTSGISAVGGSNFCIGGPFPSASRNQLTVTVSQNTLMDNLGTGIAVVGGIIESDQNTVNAMITDNTVFCSGRFGIGIAGGVGTFRTFSGPADNNTVTATISGNLVKSSGGVAGIGLAAGFSGQANSNTLNAQVEGNTACGNTGNDIYSVGGFLGSDIFPPNQGTGNQVTGSITDNTATTIVVENGVAGNTASMSQLGNLNCRPIGSDFSSIGVFRPATGRWFLDLNGNGRWDGCGVDGCLGPFGLPTDLPVAGDWNGDGTDQIGVFRPASGQWFLDLNGNGRWDGCGVDGCLGPFGAPTDLPVAGDWNGIGTAKIGVFRPASGQWFLDLNGNSRWDGCGVDGCLGPFGAPTDLPVAGDWNGDGTDQIGVFRPASGRWFLDLNGNSRWDGCGVDGCLGPFGAPTDLPVAGDWNGDGTGEMGVFRPATGRWFLDLNGNVRWDGCTVDGCLCPFGLSTDRPVAGVW